MCNSTRSPTAWQRRRVPDDYTIAFIAGTEPHDTCDQTAGVHGFFSRMFGGNSEKALPPPTTNGNPQPASGVQSEEEAKKKKSFFGKIAGVFKGDYLRIRTTRTRPRRPRTVTAACRRSKKWGKVQ